MFSKYASILAAANALDSDALTKLVEYDSIDIWPQASYYTAAITELARQVEQPYDAAHPSAAAAKVEFLLAHGSNISYAVLGAALANNATYVKALLARGANITFAAMGYAENGNFSLARWFLEQGADIAMVANSAAKGLAKDKANNAPYQKRCQFLSELRTQLHSNNKSEAYIDPIVLGAVIAGDDNYAAEQLQKTLTEKDLFQKSIFAGQAFRGDAGLQDLPNSVAQHLNLFLIWRTMGGHARINDHDQILDHNELQGLARAGHLERIQLDLRRNNRSFYNCCETHALFRQAAEGHHLQAVQQFAEQHPLYIFYITMMAHWPALNVAITRLKQTGRLVTERNRENAYENVIANILAGLDKLQSESKKPINDRLPFILCFIDESYWHVLLATQRLWKDQQQINRENTEIIRHVKHYKKLKITFIEQLILSQEITALSLHWLALTSLWPTSTTVSNGLSSELVLSIVELSCPLHHTHDEFERLGLLALKSQLSQQLLDYANLPSASNRKHAKSLRQKIQSAPDLQTIRHLLLQQFKIARANNRYSIFSKMWSSHKRNLTLPDEKFCRIIASWHPANNLIDNAYSDGVLISGTRQQLSAIVKNAVDEDSKRKHESELASGDVNSVLMNTGYNNNDSQRCDEPRTHTRRITR